MSLDQKMQFISPLIAGKLIQRRMRFLADVLLDDGTQITAHVPNSGAMLGVKDPGMRVWLSESDNPNRKLKYTLELVECDGVLVGVNTSHPNPLAERSIAAGLIPELTGYATLKREVKYGQNSRIDLLLTDPARPACYVEVKNVHMKRADDLAEFPDSITSRGAKHMAELADMVNQGHRAVVLFIVQRADVAYFSIARDLDPAYFAALNDAVKKGVQVLCYRCTMTHTKIELDTQIPWEQA